MNRISRAGATALCAGSLALAGLVTGAVGIAHAGAATPHATVSPASVPAVTTTTLPLLGAPLTITVTSGPGGALADIALSPLAADPAAPGYTATTVEPDQVRFINDAGTARIDVSSHHGGQNVSAKSGQLSDLLGPGSWAGDVFGDGTTTTVNFTIADLAGAPDITGVTAVGATNTIGAVERTSEEEEQQASVAIRFTSGLQTRTLTIRVQIGTHDGESQAKVSISLSRVNGLSLPAVQVVGIPQTWTGLLCDATTTASIGYTVNADGSITTGAISPATATVHQESEKGITVSFSKNERVQIRVMTTEDGATMQVSVKEKINCDSADPTVNVPISPNDHSDEQGDNPDDSQGDSQGGHHGSHDQTSTTVAGSGTTSSVDDHSDDTETNHDADGGSSEDGAGSGSHHG